MKRQKSECDNNTGRNRALSTQQTPIYANNNTALLSDKSNLFGGGGGLLGDTSLLQLRDAIDVIIGKLDDKIETSKRDSLRSINAEVAQPPKKALRRCKKERAISNDFITTKY